MDRKLTTDQVSILLRLREAKDHSELTATATGKAGLYAGLVELGLASWQAPAKGTRRFQLTEAGILKADELNAVLNVALPPGERPPLSGDEFQESLEQDVKDAEKRLEYLKGVAAESDARCMNTPSGYGNRQELRDTSMRDLGRVEQAEADLEKAKKDLRLFGRASA